MIKADRPRYVLDPLGEGAWRVCDVRIDEHHPDRVVAYVERTDSGEFEVVWLIAARVGSTRHPNRDDVLRAAAAMHRPVTEPTRTKPTPIPHHPPARGRPVA